MRNLVWAGLAAVGMIAADSGSLRADDIVRLGGPTAVASINGGTSTDLVYWRGRHYGGYYGYRPYYYGGYYRPYAYYRPYVYSYYRPYYYPAYYPPVYSYYPIAGDVASTVTLQSNSFAPAPAPQGFVPERLPAPNGGGTFNYNGGPNNLVPMPPADGPTPMNAPRGVVPYDGKLISLPQETTGGVSTFVMFNHSRQNQVSTPVATTTSTAPRIAYPAYGEEATPSVRKTAGR